MICVFKESVREAELDSLSKQVSGTVDVSKRNSILGVGVVCGNSINVKHDSHVCNVFILSGFDYF